MEPGYVVLAALFPVWIVTLSVCRKQEFFVLGSSQLKRLSLAINSLFLPLCFSLLQALKFKNTFFVVLIFSNTWVCD